MVVIYFHCSTLFLQIKSWRGPRVVVYRCAYHTEAQVLFLKETCLHLVISEINLSYGLTTLNASPIEIYAYELSQFEGPILLLFAFPTI